MSVLSNIKRSDYTSAVLLARMGEAQQKKAELATQRIGDGYQTKINAVNRAADRWRTVKDDVGVAVTQISATVGRLKSLLARLDGLLQTVTKAGQASDQGTINFAGYAAAFDAAVKGIAQEASKTRDGLNLLGRGEPTLTYNTAPTGTTASVQGANVGTDYTIEDTDGNRWVVDRNAGVLRQYGSYPDSPTGKMASLASGLRIDGLSGDSVDFTIQPNTASPESFSGTVQSDGLGVKDSWFYGGLASADNRARATADLKDARTALKLELQRYEVAVGVAKFYEDRAANEIGGLKEQNNAFLIQRAVELKKAQDRLSQEYRATTSSVAQALALKNRYQSLLAPLANDRLTRALLSVTV